MWGDVTQEGVLLGGNIAKTLKNAVKRVVHCGASVSFDGSENVSTTNRKGTVNLLHFMMDFDINELHYISTAYVAGLCPGQTLKESAACPTRFRNTYEHSKFEAERCVHIWAAQRDTNRFVTIYRPAIIVGHSMTGRTSCFQGFYAFVRCASLMKQALNDSRIDGKTRLRIPLTGDEPVNLVPIDYVVEFIATIVRDKPKQKEQYYHVVPKVPFTVRQVVNAIVDVFDFDGIELVGKNEVSGPNEIEKLMGENLGPYHTYFGTDSYFSTEEADKVMSWQPENPQEQLKRWINYAVDSKFGRRVQDT